MPSPPGSSRFKPRWAELIKTVHEAVSQLCPRCGGAMRIIACIDQPEVIGKFLTHLGLWPHPPLRQGGCSDKKQEPSPGIGNIHALYGYEWRVIPSSRAMWEAGPLLLFITAPLHV